MPIMQLVEELKEAKITVGEVSNLLETYKGFPVEALKERVQLAYNIRMLGKLKEALQPGHANQSISEEKLSSKLCDFLAAHWTFVKDKGFYTAFPEADSTKLLCQLAEILAKEIKDPSVTALSLLMPGVSVEDDTLPNDSASAFDIEKPLAKQLAMHIIDDSSSCLIPVSVLMSAVEEFPNVESAAGPAAIATGTSDPAVTISFEKLRSPYYDCLSYDGPENGEAGFVTKRELTRLFQHSDLTRTIESQYQSYIALRTQKDNLLGQLTLLANKLLFNSVVGIGGEEIAGSGGELAIRQFFDFYNKLNKDQVDKLPRALKAEIKLLRQCIGEYREEDRGQDGRIVAIQPIMTCLATRKSALRNSMVGQDALLESISIGGANRAGLLQKSEEDLAESLKDLQGKFNSGAYKGADCFPLTLSILKSLGLDFSLESFAELQDILSDLTVVEIASFTEDRAAAEKIATAVGSFENWVLLLHTLSVEKLKALHGNYFLEDLINKILAQSITKGRLLQLLIMQFDGEKVGLIVNLVRDCLIKDVDSLNHVIGHLTADQITVVCKALGPEFLSGLIESIQDSHNAIRYLTAAQITAVNEALGLDFLSRLIQTDKDFQSVLCSLTEAQIIAVCKALGAQRISDLIENAEDYRYVLQYLTEDQRTAVYEALGLDFLSGLIKNAEDFRNVIYYLTAVQTTAVYDALGAQHISGWIQSAEDFQNVTRYLTADQRAAVYKVLGPEFLSGWIHSAEDFQNVTRYLTAAQITAVCNSGLIVSIQDFCNVIYYFTRDQITAVFKALGPQRISGLIESIQDFHNAIRYLAAAQITTVYEALGAQRISSWIQSPEDFENVTRYLTAAQVTAVCEALGAQHISGWIQTVEDFKFVLYCLPQDQRTAVFKALGPQRISGWIHSAEDFENVTRYLTAAQITAVCNSGLIVSIQDFCNVIYYFTRDQITAVFKALGPQRISGLIESIQDFHNAIRYLAAAQITTVYEALGAQRISSWIQSPEDFENVTRYLTAAQVTAVCEALGAQHISGWIQTVEDFKFVLYCLPQDQRTAVFKALGPQRISGWIHSAEDFENVTRYLTAAQITAVCNELVEQKRLKKVFERAGVDEKFLKQLASNRNCDKKLLLVVSEITKSVDVLGAILHFHSKDNKVSKDLLMAVVKNKAYCKNKNRVQLLKSFYKSQCRSSIFNRADDVFGTDKNINKIECVIDKLYERSANNPQGASAKTLAAICRLRDYKFMKEYYVSKCRSSFFNNSNNVFKYLWGQQSIKGSLNARDKNNGASAATLDFFQLRN